MDYFELINGIESAFVDCDDFSKRQIIRDGENIYLCYIKGMSSRSFISECIVRPLLQDADIHGKSRELNEILQSASVKKLNDVKTAAERLLRGEAVVARNGEQGFSCVTANAQSGEGRSVSEPQSDVTVKGPKAGFVEDAETNMTLLRQYIRSEKLKFVSQSIGTLSHTKTVLGYVEGRADPRVIQLIKDRLENADVTSIVDSGNIELLLRDEKYSLFSVTGSSEKVDKIASKLMSGRVAVITDGSPFVITAPYVFGESIQSAEDYLRTPFYATFIRALRLLALLVALYLPALLVACLEYHTGFLGGEFVNAVMETREKIPFSLTVEMALILVMFEILREVGVRMPRTVGDAVGIVGSIIIGDSAVEAGLASPIVIITAATAAVCAFIVPAYMYATVLLRFVFLLFAFLFGFSGIAVCTLFLIFALAEKKSFGVSYLTPLAPFDKRGMEDFVMANPQKTLGRKELS